MFQMYHGYREVHFGIFSKTKNSWTDLFFIVNDISGNFVFYSSTYKKGLNVLCNGLFWTKANSNSFVAELPFPCKCVLLPCACVNSRRIFEFEFDFCFETQRNWPFVRPHKKQQKSQRKFSGIFGECHYCFCIGILGQEFPLSYKSRTNCCGLASFPGKPIVKI